MILLNIWVILHLVMYCCLSNHLVVNYCIIIILIIIKKINYYDYFKKFQDDDDDKHTFYISDNDFTREKTIPIFNNYFP